MWFVCAPAFSEVEHLPEHVSHQILEEQQQEARERERQEWEKNLCKVSCSLCADPVC